MDLLYSISYNPNGGTGGPSLQTKEPGETITLTTSKPTRTGYTFAGWGLSAMSDTVAYNGGERYSADVTIALYAMWTPLKYTVSYSLTGGTGNLPAQSKDYNVDLTIHMVYPQRADYQFEGWSISSSSSTITYRPGDVYKDNISRVLYAVWSVAPTPSKISNLSIERCSAGGVISDTGRYARITFDWACSSPITSIPIIARWSRTSGGAVDVSYNVSVSSGTSGTVNYVGYGPSGTSGYDPAYSYDFTISLNGLIFGGFLPASTFIIDFMRTGVAIGKTADTANLFDVNYQTRIRSNLTVDGSAILNYGSLTINNGSLTITSGSNQASLAMTGGSLNVTVPGTLTVNGSPLESPPNSLSITCRLSSNQTGINNANIRSLVSTDSASDNNCYIYYNSSAGTFMIYGNYYGEVYDVWMSFNLLMVPSGVSGVKTAYIYKGSTRGYCAEVWASTTQHRSQLTMPMVYIGTMGAQSQTVSVQPTGWHTNDILAAGSTTNSYGATYISLMARRRTGAVG